MNETLQYYFTLSTAELVAVVSALAYVVLAAKGSLWCWPAALLSTVLYTVIFYDIYLWSDSALQVYYFAMAIYGWVNWRKNKLSQDLNAENNRITITVKPLGYHLKAIALLTVISLAVGYLMSEYTPTHFPYLDAATTVFAIFATYLVAQRVLENWLYWVVIDLVSIYLYQAKGLTPTSVLFVLYVFLAAYAYYTWLCCYKEQQFDDNDERLS